MRANRFISEEEFKEMEQRVMTANQRYRARLRGENIPLRKHRWTKKEDVLIRHAYANLKRGDGHWNPCGEWSSQPMESPQ